MNGRFSRGRSGYCRSTAGGPLIRSAVSPVILGLCLLLAGCSDDDDGGPSTPTTETSYAHFQLTIPDGASLEVATGHAQPPFGSIGDTTVEWPADDNTVSFVTPVPEGSTTFLLSLEGTLRTPGGARTGQGILFASSRNVVGVAGDTTTVSERLSRVVPDTETMVVGGDAVRLRWNAIGRAESYDVRSENPTGEVDIVSRAVADTTFPLVKLEEEIMVTIRSVLRDGRVSAYSTPHLIEP